MKNAILFTSGMVGIGAVSIVLAALLTCGVPSGTGGVMSQMSDQRKLMTRLVRLGATIEVGGSHFKIKADGVLIGILPRHGGSAGGSPHAMRNVAGQCRRAGLDV